MALCESARCRAMYRKAQPLRFWLVATAPLACTLRRPRRKSDFVLNPPHKPVDAIGSAWPAEGSCRFGRSRPNIRDRCDMPHQAPRVRTRRGRFPARVDRGQLQRDPVASGCGRALPPRRRATGRTVAARRIGEADECTDTLHRLMSAVVVHAGPARPALKSKSVAGCKNCWRRQRSPPFCRGDQW
jgi:hypothetical protein